MPQMNGHSVLRSHFIPAAEKFHQQSVIARRVLRQLFPMLIRSNSGNHRQVKQGSEIGGTALGQLVFWVFEYTGSLL